jgi:hypothetical protein
VGESGGKKNGEKKESALVKAEKRMRNHRTAQLLLKWQRAQMHL